MMNDATLLRRYAETRAEDAFAELVRRHVNLVYRSAWRQLGGDAHRAADVTQVVFTLLARKAATLGRHPSLMGWLYTTTRLTVRGLQRDERRRQAREQEALIMHELSSDAAAAAEWERLRPVLDEAMGTLGDRDREALLARFFEGRPFAEIGAAMQVSEDAARMRVERALDRLRGLLARRGITSTGAALGLMLANESAIAMPVGLATNVTQAALSAAGVTAPAVTLISIMSTSKIGVSVAGAALAVTLWMTGYEIYRSHTARTAEAAAQRMNGAPRRRRWWRPRRSAPATKGKPRRRNSAQRRWRRRARIHSRRATRLWRGIRR